MHNRIGVISDLKTDLSNFQKVKNFGLRICQLVSWQPNIWTAELAEGVKKTAVETGIRITGFWAGWPGPRTWNLIDGPTTLGLIPKEYREMRVEALRRAGNFAKIAGIPAVITHMGFIPENPRDKVFNEIVEITRDLANYLKKLDLQFWFETGQETPITMKRLIVETGTNNLGINLDPANLILYGKANPIDALDVFGEYVRNIHAKDGMYPTDPMKLGVEVKVGQGRVRYPDFIKRLNEIGFKGEFIIEREISGKQQDEDIRETINYLVKLICD